MWSSSSLASFKLANGMDNRQISSCNSSMSFNNGSTADSGFSENDEDYINSSVMEAVEVKSGQDGFVIKMRDGHFVKCVHNNPDCAPNGQCLQTAASHHCLGIALHNAY
jgi:hypothetical protein